MGHHSFRNIGCLILLRERCPPRSGCNSLEFESVTVRESLASRLLGFVHLYAYVSPLNVVQA